MKSIMLSFTLVATILTAADSPFMGRWKLNLDKSDGGDISVSFEGTTSGEMRVSGCCLATGTFRFDENDYKADFGIIAAWKQIDAHAWESVHKRNGTVVHRDHLTLSEMKTY